jgi:hypothetical protein
VNRDLLPERFPPEQGVQVPTHPPLPVYDPAKDGNRFQWIVRVAQEVRAKRLEERNGPLWRG